METRMRPVERTFDTWTLEDLDALDRDRLSRYEIVDGALVVSPPPGGDHELAGEDLRSVVRVCLPEGYVVVGPLGVEMPPTYLEPDLLVALRTDVKGALRLRPDQVLLVVEIVSPSSVSMDRLVKPAKYAGAGIPHFWRVENDPVSLTAYVLDGATYREVGSWGPGETAELTSPFPVTVQMDLLG